MTLSRDGSTPTPTCPSGKVVKRCGPRTTKRVSALPWSVFLWSGQPIDWGDLFQLAAPADIGKAAKQENSMRKLKCRPGDLAIIIEAFNSVNIGAIVKVISKHRNQRVIHASSDDFIWLVEAPHPLTYEVSGKLFRKRKGGAPDSGLQPIRGLPLVKDITTNLVDPCTTLTHDAIAREFS